MKINRRPQIGPILLFIVFVLSGCAGAIGLIPQMAQLGASAAASIEDTDINSAVSPGFTKEDFEKIKRIAVIFNQPEQQMTLQGSNLANSIADSFTVELMNLGFDVIERQQLTSIMNEQQLQLSGLTSDKLLEVGKVFGVNAVVTGSVTGSQSVSTGFMGSGVKMTSLVQNASLKIIGAENARTMMIITINYKHGQKPNDAARTIAKILKLKIEDPFGEVGKEKS